MKNSHFKLLFNSKIVFFLALIVMLLIISSVVEAQIRVPFKQRTSQYSPTKNIYNIKGDFTMIGNTNLTLQNYGNQSQNGNNFMRYVDIDNDANTWNSSSSTLALSTENGAIPSCSRIVYAGLYWTGRATDNNTSSTTFSVTKNGVTKKFDKRVISLKGPASSSYTQFNANTNDIYYPTTSDGYMYSAYTEVTDYVRNNGIGEYFAADIALIQGDGGGTGYYGGWGMVIVYENSKMKNRDITIFDGHAYVQSATATGFELPVSGFNTIQKGPVGIKLGLISGEGDSGISGDYFAIQKQNDATFLKLNHLSNTTENFFNSSIETGGNLRNPKLSNNTGIDISMFTIPNVENSVITNNQTTTKFKYGSTQDTFIIFSIAMAVDAYIPDPEIICSVTSINGTSVDSGLYNVTPGQELEYKIKILNKGTEAINNAKIKIPIPYAANYTNGSATKIINFGAPTPNNLYFDSSDGINGSIIWDIGTLPIPINPNDVLGELTFKIKITEDCTIIKNTNCHPNITLYGYFNGIGAITGISLDNKPFIQGYNASSICQGEPIMDPIVVNIVSENFLSQNCQNTPNDIAFTFCNVIDSIPISQISGVFPIGTRFYNNYPVVTGAIEYTNLNSFPASLNTNSYYGIPPGSNNCYYKFTIATHPSLSITSPKDYNIEGCNTNAINELTYSETETNITIDQFIAIGGIISNKILNYIISYKDTKSSNCPIIVKRVFTIKSLCETTNFTQLITIIDTTLPTASNPVTINLTGCNGTFPAQDVSVVMDETDNCSSPTVAFVSDSAPIVNGCSETTIRTYSVTDTCGNSIAVTQNLIRTIDTTLPTASNPAAITLTGCNGTFPAPDVSVVMDEADNCGSPTVAFVSDSAPMVNGCSETTIRTYSVTDTCGNTIEATQNLIRTIDATLPTKVTVGLPLPIL